MLDEMPSIPYCSCVNQHSSDRIHGTSGCYACEQIVQLDRCLINTIKTLCFGSDKHLQVATKLLFDESGEHFLEYGATKYFDACLCVADIKAEEELYEIVIPEAEETTNGGIRDFAYGVSF